MIRSDLRETYCLLGFYIRNSVFHCSTITPRDRIKCIPLIPKALQSGEIGAYRQVALYAVMDLILDMEEMNNVYMGESLLKIKPHLTGISAMNDAASNVLRH